jgi:hypothetical protein
LNVLWGGQPLNLYPSTAYSSLFVSA